MPKALFKTEEEWIELIQLYNTSGMSAADFCEEFGISTTSLHRYINKVRNKTYETAEGKEQKHEVVPIEVTGLTESVKEDCIEGSQPGAAVIQKQESRIHVKCGCFFVDIDDGADHKTLRDTLGILHKLC